MTSRDFAFWLQGFYEIQKPQTINETQTNLIERHLALVFKHEIDPSMGDAKHQAELNTIHADDISKSKLTAEEILEKMALNLDLNIGYAHYMDGHLMENNIDVKKMMGDKKGLTNSQLMWLVGISFLSWKLFNYFN